MHFCWSFKSTRQPRRPMSARNCTTLCVVCLCAVATLFLPVALAAQAPATIYIYWPKQQRGNGKPKVLCDGQVVANLQNGRYIVLTAPPGAHTIKFHKGDIAAT